MPVMHVIANMPVRHVSNNKTALCIAVGDQYKVMPLVRVAGTLHAAFRHFYI